MRIEELSRQVDDLTNEVMDNIERLRYIKNKHSELKIGYTLNAGSILNAYREGDIDFEEAKKAIEKVNNIKGENMKKRYHKVISLSGFKHGTKDINRLVSIIHRLGYTSNDYRINYFGNDAEMIISNQELHRDLKVIRATRYNKKAQ